MPRVDAAPRTAAGTSLAVHAHLALEVVPVKVALVVLSKRFLVREVCATGAAVEAILLGLLGRHAGTGVLGICRT